MYQSGLGWAESAGAATAVGLGVGRQHAARGGGGLQGGAVAGAGDEGAGRRRRRVGGRFHIWH